MKEGNFHQVRIHLGAIGGGSISTCCTPHPKPTLDTKRGSSILGADLNSP